MTDCRALRRACKKMDMRWCLLLAAFLSIALACGEGLNRGTGGGGGSLCDGKSTCAECRECATSNPCRDETDNCQNSGDCQGVQQCIEIVCAGDVQCENECRTNNPSGAAIYNVLLECIYCQQCNTQQTCAGFRECT